MDALTEQNADKIIEPAKQTEGRMTEAIEQNADKILERALDIGEAMLRSGAEILRIEETIIRICSAYGDGIVDVFTILSLIIVSWKTPDGRSITQTRRIYSYSTDLERLEELNALSRYICANKPPSNEIEKYVNEIMCGENRHRNYLKLAGYVLTASAFAVFFGGNIRDGIAAGLVGIVLYIWDFIFAPHSKNRVVYSLISSIAAGITCIAAVNVHIGVNMDSVMIGSIMILIPGISTVNSLRDMMRGDIITGILRLAEALMIAAAIAAGYGIAIMLMAF